jgi:hypothetical protein
MHSPSVLRLSEVGVADGTVDGPTDGVADGTTDGTADGVADGTTDGTADGIADGTADADGDADANTTSVADPPPPPPPSPSPPLKATATPTPDQQWPRRGEKHNVVPCAAHCYGYSHIYVILFLPHDHYNLRSKGAACAVLLDSTPTLDT